MPYSIPLNSFKSGVWSPTSIGRVDDENYKSACLQIENFYVKSPFGGVVKRPGTELINTSTDITNKINLINFNSSATDKYIIELGNYYARFYNEAGLVTLSGSAYEIETPFSSDIIDEIKYVQNKEDIYLVHNTLPPMKLSRNDETDWTIEEVEFTWPAFINQNKDETKTYSLTYNTDNVTVTASGFEPFSEDSVGRYIRLTGTTTVNYVLTTSGTYTDYLTLKYGKILKASIQGTWDGEITIQRSDDLVDWWDYTEYSDTESSITITEAKDFGYYRAYCSEANSGSANIYLTKTSVTGYLKITEYLSSNSVYAEELEEIPTQSPNYKWSEGAFDSEKGYPGAIDICEQRLILAETPNNPNTLWGSKTGEYENFDEDDVNDADGFINSLSSKRTDVIYNLISYNGSCHIFADELGYRLSGYNGSITPTSNQIDIDLYIGSANVQAIGADNRIIFVEMFGKDIAHKYYDADTESYAHKNISKLAENLFESKIIKLGYARSPNSLLYALKEDGTMAVCCYDVSNGLVAWSEYVTDGSIESFTIIPGDNEHIVWLSVIRNGYRCIEKISSSVWANIEESNYLDSVITYSGTPLDYIQGLGHLEGMTVGVTCSGGYIGDYTVTEGQVVLENSYGQISAGLKYDVILKTMPVEVPGNMGNSINKKKHINAVSIGLYKSLGGMVGYNEDNLDDIPEIDNGVYVYGSVPDLTTGYIEMPFSGFTMNSVSVLYKNTDPVPVHITSIIADITIN